MIGFRRDCRAAVLLFLGVSEPRQLHGIAGFPLGALAASAWHAHLVSEAGGQEHTNGSVPVLSCCQSSHCTPWRACCHAVFSPSSNAASRERLQCAWCRRSRASSADHGKIAAVPPLWSVKELNESFVVRDATGQPLAYVFEDGRQRQMSMR